MTAMKQERIPKGIQKRFEKPDMKIRTGDTDAVVVFAAQRKGFAAYCRLVRKGEESISVFKAESRNEVIDAAVVFVFNPDASSPSPKKFDLRKYGGKQK